MIRFRIPILPLFLLLLYGCGPKPEPSHSPLDTPSTHYSRGLASFEQGKLMEVQTECERAASLDDDYPGIFVGYALVYMAQGEFWTAHQQIEKALHEDDDFADAYIARGRFLAAEGLQRGFGPKDWWKEALRAFDSAIDLQPADDRAYFHQGMAYLAAHDRIAAEESFLQVQKLKRGPLT